MACSFADYVGVGSQVISTKLLTDDNIVSKFGVKLKMMTRQKPEKWKRRYWWSADTPEILEFLQKMR